MIKLVRNFWEIIKSCSTDSKYKKYLQHRHHHQEKPLSKKDFFAREEQQKWNKINRCC